MFNGSHKYTSWVFITTDLNLLPSDRCDTFADNGTAKEMFYFTCSVIQGNLNVLSQQLATVLVSRAMMIYIYC